MSTPTPRTDAAWASSFEPCEYRAAHTARTMRDECVKLERELAIERAKVRVLHSALQNLVDEQNDAPLETRRAHWQMAMDEAGLALATAAQRAEAFLRTLGKWEDDK